MEDIFETTLTNRSAYIRHNRNQIENEYKVIVRGLDLITQITEGNINKEKFKALPEEERNIWWGTFAHFKIDSFNSIINSLNLLLVGCRSDAIALMRNILEAECILEYGLRFNKMKEIRKRYVFGIGKKPERKDILNELDKNGEERYGVWNSFSESGSHVLSDRMQGNFCWDMGGKIEQIQGGHCLSRRELIQETLILIQLLEYAIKNCKTFFKQYEDFLRNKNFLKHSTDWLSESSKIIANAKLEFKELE
jgi:hypothetical protein